MLDYHGETWKVSSCPKMCHSWGRGDLLRDLQSAAQARLLSLILKGTATMQQAWGDKRKALEVPSSGCGKGLGIPDPNSISWYFYIFAEDHGCSDLRISKWGLWNSSINGGSLVEVIRLLRAGADPTRQNLSCFVNLKAPCAGRMRFLRTAWLVLSSH